MASPIIAISINSSWNVVNFRAGLVRGLQQAGYRVAVIAPEDDYTPQVRALGADFIPIDIDQQGLSPVRDLRLARDYRRIIAALKPACFLGYTAKPNVYGSIAAHRLRVPVINNISGLGTAFIRGSMLRRIVTSLYRFALRRSAVVFFQNDEDRDLFVRERLVTEDQARLLPGSGVDLTRFHPAPAPARDGTTFLFVGRILWDKGVGELVEAARIVRARRPDVRVQLLGRLGAENRTAIPEDQFRQWVSEGLVEYLGHADEVLPFIAAADCIVLPSYREGLSRSLLEAAAMARPLIATDVPGCRQIARAGDNAFLCPARDAAGLADAMLRFAELPPEARARMGRRSREIVEAEYDEQHVIALYLAAIRDALKPTGAGARRPS